MVRPHARRSGPAVASRPQDHYGGGGVMVETRGAAGPRLLIEDWLPAGAIGVECIRERSTGQQPPDKRFHVWWARRPLVASRAAALGSRLPADFHRETFE